MLKNENFTTWAGIAATAIFIAVAAYSVQAKVAKHSDQRRERLSVCAAALEPLSSAVLAEFRSRWQNQDEALSDDFKALSPEKQKKAKASMDALLPGIRTIYLGKLPESEMLSEVAAKAAERYKEWPEFRNHDQLINADVIRLAPKEARAIYEAKLRHQIMDSCGTL